MFPQLLGLLAVGFVLLLIYAWFKPAKFRVERSISIAAPPQAIHPQIANFRKWSAWSPWEALDPHMIRTYKGPEEGVGAGYAWEGRKAGSGNMLITRSDPENGISLDLNFTKPFKASNITDIILAPDNGDTRVTWAMHGPHPYMMRVMSVFFSMDRMVGKDFEKGLANLKSLTEG